MAYDTNSALPVGPALQTFPSTADDVFHASNAQVSITLDGEGKWIPTTSFTRLFEYDELDG